VTGQTDATVGAVDLHLHSTYSDGTFSPSEVVRRASEAGLSTISLTDHDSIDGHAEAAETGEALGVEVIPGAELSVNADGKDLHLLAYCVDPDHRAFRDALRFYREERTRRAERMVKKLNRMGMRVQMAHVKAKAGDGAIGRPHVADVMVEEGFVFSTNEAFQKFIGYGKPAYESKYSMPPSEAIDLIHSAGGLACLAHPGLYGGEEMIPTLIDAGMDALEVVHTKHGPSEVARFSEIADRHRLVKTGGSDCHGDGRGPAVIGTVNVPPAFADSLKAAWRARS
jgi:predicted metal-dependent phosphoesterase TrpH